MKSALMHIALFVAILLSMCNASLGETTATITKTVDGREQISAELGDKLRVTLIVENPYAETVLVVDDLGSACRYIAGTCRLDGTSLTPTLRDNTISLSVGQGHHEITYEFQVVQVEAINTYVISGAQVYRGGSVVAYDDLQITLSPYNGFFKFLWCQSYPAYPATMPALPLKQNIVFLMEVNIRNYFDFTMENLELSDNLPAEFEVDAAYAGTGTAEFSTKKGKPGKASWSWTVGNLGPDGSASLWVYLSTAVNPAGKQHFISPGWYEVGKGVSIKLKDPSTGNELRANTHAFFVYAG